MWRWVERVLGRAGRDRNAQAIGGVATGGVLSFTSNLNAQKIVRPVPREHIETVADILDHLCFKTGATYAARRDNDGTHRVWLDYPNGDRLTAQGKTRREAVQELLARAGGL